jgi:hypothetical protein
MTALWFTVWEMRNGNFYFMRLAPLDLTTHNTTLSGSHCYIHHGKKDICAFGRNRKYVPPSWQQFHAKTKDCHSNIGNVFSRVHIPSGILFEHGKRFVQDLVSLIDSQSSRNASIIFAITKFRRQGGGVLMYCWRANEFRVPTWDRSSPRP